MPRRIRPIFTVVLSGALVFAASAASGTGDNSWDKESVAVDARAQEELAATGDQNLFSEFAEEVIEAHPDAVIDHQWAEDHGELWVLNETVKMVEADAKQRNVPVTVHGVSDGIPVTQRSDVELQALEAAADSGVDAVSARYEASENQVTVAVREKDSATKRQSVKKAITADAHQSRSLASENDFDVTVEFDENLETPTEDADTRGGLAYSTCTGGFIGKRGSQWGIITSAHCTSKPAKYDGATTGATYTGKASNKDVRFTRLTGGTATNKFRNAPGSFRALTGTGIINTGDTLYKYGKTTGYDSAKIASYQGCVTFASGNIWCDLYKTNKQVTSGGDSGGPWFIGFTGKGFTTGSSTSGSYITPQTSLSAISGNVSIKTQ